MLGRPWTKLSERNRGCAWRFDGTGHWSEVSTGKGEIFWQFYFELVPRLPKMPSPDKVVDLEGTDKSTNSEVPNTRHAEYYFAFTIFLVSDVYDNDQADWTRAIRSRTSYSKSHVATLRSNQSSSLICFSSQHPATVPRLKERAMIDLFVLMGLLRNQISYSCCASCFPCEWFPPTAISAIFKKISTSRDSQSSNTLSIEEWISVLKLSTMWQIQNIRGRAIKALGLPLTDIRDLEMKHGEITVASYRDRIRLERKFPFPCMLDLIKRRVGQDLYLAAISIFTSSKNEAVEMVDLGLVTQSQYNSLLRYRDRCRSEAVEVASPSPHYRFKWMSQRYNWFRTDVEHDCNRGGNIFIGNIQGKSTMRYWWREYMNEAELLLAKRPWGATVTSGDFFDQALRDGSRCRVCRENLDHDFRQFTNIFASKIDDAVSEARCPSRLSVWCTNINFWHRFNLYSRTYKDPFSQLFYY